MSDLHIGDGFADDLAEARSPAGTGGCCGNAAQTALALPESTAGPCCGSAAEATAANSCCGSAAKAEAVTTGQGCC